MSEKGENCDTRHLFTSTMYPFVPLQLTLLVWQRGEEADQQLSNSDVEDECSADRDDSATAPTIRYCTQEAYERSVTPDRPFPLFTQGLAHAFGPIAAWKGSTTTMRGLALNCSSNACQQYRTG